MNLFLGVDESEVFEYFVPNEAHLVDFLPVLGISDSEGIDRELADCLEEDFATLRSDLHKLSNFPVVLCAK